MAFTVKAQISTRQDGSIEVSTYWQGGKVDRREGIGWRLGSGKMKLAERLARAIDAGAIFGDAHIRTDVNGKTYIDHGFRNYIRGRCMNADLKRIGY